VIVISRPSPERFTIPVGPKSKANKKLRLSRYCVNLRLWELDVNSAAIAAVRAGPSVAS